MKIITFGGEIQTIKVEKIVGKCLVVAFRKKPNAMFRYLVSEIYRGTHGNDR